MYVPCGVRRSQNQNRATLLSDTQSQLTSCVFQSTIGSDTIDTRDLSTLSNGVRVFTNKGGKGTGATIEIPAGLKGVKVQPVIGELIDTTATKIPLLFTVDSPGSGSLLVRDEVDATDTEYDDFSYDVTTEDDFSSSVDVALDGEVEADYAYDEESINTLLEDGQDFDIVDPDGEGDIDYMLTDEEGNALYESSFDGNDEDGTQITELDFNEETGEMDISDVAIEFDDFSFDGSDTTEPTTDDSVVDQPTDSVVDDTPVDEEPAEETEAP